MANPLLADVINDVRHLLDDVVGGARWTTRELVRSVDAAQGFIVQQKPDANYKLDTVPLVAGVRQQLPADAFSLVQIFYSISTADPTHRIAMRETELRIFNTNPNWILPPDVPRLPTAYIFDPRLRRHFMVHPAVPNNFCLVEAGYSILPETLHDPTSANSAAGSAKPWKLFVSEAGGDRDTTTGAYATAELDLERNYLAAVQAFVMVRSMAKYADDMAPGGMATWMEQLHYSLTGERTALRDLLPREYMNLMREGN